MNFYEIIVPINGCITHFFFKITVFSSCYLRNYNEQSPFNFISQTKKKQPAAVLKTEELATLLRLYISNKCC